MANSVTWTERQILDLLYARHSRVTGNGPEWAYMEHVRDAAGFYANTTIDALAMHLWPSRSHEVHAYEVKCTRSDFRRELTDEQAKSASWRGWVDYFWIVAPANVVPLDDLPDGWGLMAAHESGIRKVRQATRLQPKPPGYVPAADIPRGLVASMLRAQVRNGRKMPGCWTEAEHVSTS